MLGMANNHLVTVAEAATQSGYDVEHIRHLAREGEIESMKVGPTVLVNVAQLKARRAITGGKGGKAIAERTIAA